MSGITSILDMATRALLAEQLGVEVTSHNVANVNTPGYSRQRVNFETAYPIPSAFGPLGTGVRVRNIERAFDPFITARLDEKTSSLADYQTRSAALEEVASFFNETREGGVNDLLSQFWAAWHDLADNPAGQGERQTLLAQAQSLCEAFSSRAGQLVTERTQITQKIAPLLDEINAHAVRLTELNREIQETEANGQLANDLRDQRQLELQQLSQLLGVRYYTGSDGMINVTLANGLPLVQGVLAFDLTFQMASGDTIQVNWQGPSGLTEDITPFLNGGKLNALITVRDQLIPQYQQDLDQLARDLIYAVNEQHSQGAGLELFDSLTGTYAVDDPGNPLNNADLPFGDRILDGSFELQVERSGALLARSAITVTAGMSLSDLVNAINADPGVGSYLTASVDDGKLNIVANQATDTFGFANDTSRVLLALGLNTFFAGDKAYTFEVNAWVLDNPQFIAAGKIDVTGARAPGDNTNALALADLENAPAATGSLTFADSYRRLVTAMGLDFQQAGAQADFLEGLVQQLTQMRDAVSAVSLDEELANLIKFQRAYQAAARLITTADELYQTLLSIKR